MYAAFVDEQRSLVEIMNALGEIYDDYNWLITEFDIYSNSQRLDFNKLESADYLWMDGAEFRNLLGEDDFYTIWCVVSGIKKDVPLKNVLTHPLPYADGNRNFWGDDPEPQNPFAEMEIVKFDGSYCFIISREQEHVERFMAKFDGAYDLIAENRKVNRQVRRIEDVMNTVYSNMPEEKKYELKWKVYHAIFNDKETEPDDEQIVGELKNLYNQDS